MCVKNNIVADFRRNVLYIFDIFENKKNHFSRTLKTTSNGLIIANYSFRYESCINYYILITNYEQIAF